MDQLRTLAEQYPDPAEWQAKACLIDRWRSDLVSTELRRWCILVKTKPRAQGSHEVGIDWKQIKIGIQPQSRGNINKLSEAEWISLHEIPSAVVGPQGRHMKAVREAFCQRATEVLCKIASEPEEVRWFVRWVDRLVALQLRCFTPEQKRLELISELWSNALTHKHSLAKHALGIPLVLLRALNDSIAATASGNWREAAGSFLDQLLRIREVYCDVMESASDAKASDDDKRAVVYNRLAESIDGHVKNTLDAVAWQKDTWGLCVLDPFMVLYRVFSQTKTYGEILDAIHQPLAQELMSLGINQSTALSKLATCAGAINSVVQGQEVPVDLSQHEIEDIINNAGLPAPLILRLLESGEFIRFVRRDGRNLYQIKYALDYRYIYKRLFGFKTGMRGLDYLFYGGLLLREDKGSVILLRGNPGNGKSTFALHLLAELAKTGAICLYFTVEEDIREIERTINVYNLHDPQSMDLGIVRSIHDRNRQSGDVRIETLVRNAVEQGKGLLRVSELLSHDFHSAGTIVADDVSEAQRVIDQCSESQSRKIVIAIDSLGAIPYPTEDGKGDHTTADKAREEFVRRVTKLRYHVSLCVLVSEAMPDWSDKQFEAYVADGLINFGTLEAEAFGGKMKTIEIEKARFQEVHHETHPFSIEDGMGCVIHPAMASILRAREKRLEKPAQSYIPTGIDGLDRALGGYGIAKNTVTLCVGEAGMGKSVVAMHCLLSPESQHDTPWTHASEERVLIVNFRSRQLLPIMGHNISFISRRHARKLCHGAIEELQFAPSARTAEEVLGRVVDTLSDAKNRGEPITRVLVVDMGHAKTNLPALAQDDLFATAILAVLRTACVTAIISCGTGSKTGSDFLATLQHNVHNHLHFRKIGVQGEERRGITVDMSSSDEHSQRFFELVETGDTLRLEDRFQRYMGFDRDNAVAVPITVYLYEETSEQGAYNNRLEQELKMALGRLGDESAFQLLRSHPRSAPFIRPALELSANSPKSTLRIFCVDEYQLTSLRESQLEYISDDFRYPDLPGSSLSNLYVKYMLDTACNPHTGRLCAIPYYRNVSVLCFDKTKLSEIQQSALLEAAENPADLADFLDAEGLLLDFPACTDQNYNVFFLGLLFSTGGKRPGGGRCLRKYLQDKDRVCEAAELAYRLVGSRPSALLDERPKKGKYGVETGKNSLIARQWLSTVPAFARVRGIRLADVGVCRAPGVSFSGDWYLAVEKGSAALDYAWRVLYELTSYRENQLRLRMAVGAPARKDASLDAGRVFGLDNEEFQKLHYRAVRRGSLNCYYALSDWLAQYIREILAATSSDERIERAEALARRSNRFSFAEHCDTCPRNPLSRMKSVI